MWASQLLLLPLQRNCKVRVWSICYDMRMDNFGTNADTLATLSIVKFAKCGQTISFRICKSSTQSSSKEHFPSCLMSKPSISIGHLQAISSENGQAWPSYRFLDVVCFTMKVEVVENTITIDGLGKLCKNTCLEVQQLELRSY